MPKDTFLQAPRRKRSSHVALVLAGAAAMSLSACQEERVDAQSFPDLQSCIAGAQESGIWFTETDCRTQFATAEADYRETAPRYDSKALCEQEHGEGNCGADPVAAPSGGGGVFMPLLTGFLIGNMLSRGGVFGQPLMNTRGGGFTTPSGQQTFASNHARGKVAPASFSRAAPTMGRQPMTQADVAKRGGFGASNTQRGTGKVFGG